MARIVYESDNMDKQIAFFKSLIDGVENSNHSAEQSMGKAYGALFPDNNAGLLRGGMRVKQLTWDGNSIPIKSLDETGYHIGGGYPEKTWKVRKGNPLNYELAVDNISSVEEAKSIAQEHFEKTIISAFENWNGHNWEKITKELFDALVRFDEQET